MLYLISKIFLHANLMVLCPVLKDGDKLTLWMSFFNQVLEKEVPSELLQWTDNHDEVVERRKAGIWKLKEVVSQICYSMILKYGRTDRVSVHDKQLAQYFQA